MLHIVIPKLEVYNEQTGFFTVGPFKLQLEHSLVSISKWDSKHKKAFLKTKEKTTEEMIDYIRCMTMTPNTKPETYDLLTRDNLYEVKKYMEDSMTATILPKLKSKPNNETLTSEYIYYLMTVHNIDFECQKWHLNRLLTLIELCNAKNNPGKKMSAREIMAQNKAANEARKKQYKTNG